MMGSEELSEAAKTKFIAKRAKAVALGLSCPSLTALSLLENP